MKEINTLLMWRLNKMKKIEAILKCYGEKALKQDTKIIRKGIDYNTWMIEEIETKEELEKIYSKKQIIDIYESAYNL